MSEIADLLEKWAACEQLRGAKSVSFAEIAPRVPQLALRPVEIVTEYTLTE